MAYQLGCFNRPWNQLTYAEALRDTADADLCRAAVAVPPR